MGSWVVDQIKVVDQYPEQDGLANILRRYTNTGGSPYNVLKNISHLGANFKLSGVGLIGQDHNGNYIIDDCIKSQIDKRGLQTVEKGTTSYTDVITDQATGRRTFFHEKGVNKELSKENIRLEKYKAKIFHLGYLLLLDKLDQVHENGRTEASDLLEEASELGFTTSVDLFNERSERFAPVVKASLPFCDYLFTNNQELGRLSGTDLQQSSPSFKSQFNDAIKQVFDMGVRQWIIADHDTGIYAFHRNGEQFAMGKSLIPTEAIAGQAGVTDAIAAGVLYGMHEGWDIEKTLMLAACTHACSLMDPSCTEGILPLEQTMDTGKQWGFAPI